MNRKNLKKLADYLATGNTAMKFDMMHLCRNLYGSVGHADMHTCGTVACAIGHGPAAGIPPLAGEKWSQYPKRVFDLKLDEWDWCFSGHWADYQPSPQEAADRIYELLDGEEIISEEHFPWKYE